MRYCCIGSFYSDNKVVYVKSRLFFISLMLFFTSRVSYSAGYVGTMFFT